MLQAVRTGDLTAADVFSMGFCEHVGGRDVPARGVGP
jgi:hypothetical protein